MQVSCTGNWVERLGGRIVGRFVVRFIVLLGIVNFVTGGVVVVISRIAPGFGIKFTRYGRRLFVRVWFSLTGLLHVSIYYVQRRSFGFG